jgi:hypothetical protein
VSLPCLKFSFDDVQPQPAVEPPLLLSDVAPNHVPNPYVTTNLTHEKIHAIREKSSLTAEKRQQIDYSQSFDLYPSEFPYFVRGHDSLRTYYVTKLFSSQIAINDGAMGTMILYYAKKHKLDEGEYRGDRFKDWDWDCNMKGTIDMLSITQPHIISGIYKQYLEEGGSNLIGTNTLLSTTIAMGDYNMQKQSHLPHHRRHRH